IEKVHKRVTEKDDIVLGIILKETNEFIGVMDLMRNLRHNNGEFGYWLGFDYWGKGIMTEVVKAFTEYCLKELKLHRLVIKAFTFNPASAKVAIKNGYEYEGCSKGDVLKDGKYYDTETYALINKDN
ncbi:MAG: GNAT family N-acetyltransferase, partial [Clostridia bacterium]|nr:GNAT family N-acetyltransferase [Clostridia bacterium]